MKNNLKKKFWILIPIILIIVGISVYGISKKFHKEDKLPQVCSPEKCFTVELARTQSEQELGLMNRSFMAEKSGMLFMFPKNDIYTFRMKNTLIPLDMVRIDTTLRVVRVMTAQPCTADPCTVYNPRIGAIYVLEINSGIAAKYGIVEGTQMRLKNIK